jgi:flagellar hook-basal body complex protein FliE
MNIPISGIFSTIPTGISSPLSGKMEPAGNSGGFGDVLKSAIGQVSSLQGSAETQVGNLLQGGNADMSKVMISVEKADVAFQLMMQVRNKIVTAYQDIEKMQF